MFKRPHAHGMLVSVLFYHPWNETPGKKYNYLSQNVSFRAPVKMVGDTLAFGARLLRSVTIKKKSLSC